jgi:acetyltransferase-like isoleucine patch superfamily enzyme
MRRVLRRTPAPNWLTAAYLSARWRCRVSPAARVRYPFNVELGRGTRIGRATIIASGGGVALADGVEIGEGAVLNAQAGRIAVGARSAVGPYVVIYGEGSAAIGSDVGIAAHTTIVALEHVFEDRDVPIRRQGSTALGIRIEDDVWLGSNVVVLDGVVIGHGCVVAAGAVVTRSVDPYTVSGGVPAKAIRQRTST